jgi:RES domain-containing protein
MAQFEHVGAYRGYRLSVLSNLRYVREQRVDEFLQTVLTTASKREQEIKSGTILWRAQLGSAFEQIKLEGVEEGLPVPRPYPIGRMKPIAYRAVEGRANPKGIPVLYLATEQDTAMREIRPWISSDISIAKFEVKRDLRIVDCSLASKPLWPELYERRDNLSADDLERSNWADIDLDFAQPVDRRDDVADYAPTQIIAELFKHAGYDGIKYQSALSTTGHNVALFDISAADPVSCELFTLRKIDFKFEPSVWNGV